MWSNEDELLDFIGRIYDASYEPERWRDILKSVTESTGARSSALFYRDIEYPRSSIVIHYGISEETLDRYYKKFFQIDPFPELSAAIVPMGTVCADHMIAENREELEQLCGEFYQGMMVEYDQYHIAGANLMMDDRRFLAIAMQRGKAAGPYTDKELENLQVLIPHFERAFRIHNEFTRLIQRKQLLTTVLDQMMIGFVLLNGIGKPLHINPTAREITRKHGAIQVTQNAVRASDPEDDEKLQALIKRCLAAGQEQSELSTAGGSVGLHHQDARFPLPVLVSPVSQTKAFNHGALDQGTVAIFITDPDIKQPISASALELVYGFTQREAEVAIALVNGQKVEEIAQLSNTTQNTVRTQVKSLFRKTNTCRQTELIRLLISGPFKFAS